LFGAATVGLSQAWAQRFYIEPDGVNYLDIANTYVQHDWKNAINAYWSPLWSLLLGLILWLTHPSLYWESTLVHFVSFLVYICVLTSFTWFLQELIALCSEQANWKPKSEGLTTLAWLILGYTTLTHVLLVMGGPGLDTPDLCVATLFFIASAMLVRMRRGVYGWRLCVGLGAVLGLAYLSKAVMFPLGFVFLFCGIFVTNDRKRAMSGMLLAFLVFLAISGPFLVILSHAKNRLTFGDCGRLAYAWLVNGGGTHIHGMRQLSEVPRAYEFSTPIAGTYPPWYDPSYWNEGILPRFDWRAQLRRLRSSGHEYFLILSARRALAVGLLVLLLFAGDPQCFRKAIGILWTVWLPALAALVLYAMVYVEPRYIPAAELVLWCSAFAAIRLPRLDTSRRLGNCVAIAVAVALGITILSETFGNLAAAAKRPHHLEWEVAMSLRQKGLRPADTVAVLGHEDKADYWAHLAQVRIVADLSADELPSFWEASAEVQSFVLDAFANTGAKILVTHAKPPAAHSEGWQRLNDTDYFALPLSNRMCRKQRTP